MNWNVLDIAKRAQSEPSHYTLLSVLLALIARPQLRGHVDQGDPMPLRQQLREARSAA